ncbi:MAG TPA: phosphoribosyltransferase family protein [Candidatus Limnocylindrales bacterium]
MGWWRRTFDPQAATPSGTDARTRFRDREAAGLALAARLAAGAASVGDPPQSLADEPARVVVLGIPRGGVPVAAAVARALGARLDILVAHKVGAPHQPELAVGAVASDGSVRREAWAGAYVSERGFTDAAAAEIARARAREHDLRGGRPAVPLAGVTAVLVDDGVATGSTMLVAVEAARRAGAVRVVVAVPVAAEEAVAALSVVADAVVAVAVPARFGAVGAWYVRFDQVDDAEVRRFLAVAG